MYTYAPAPVQTAPVQTTYAPAPVLRTPAPAPKVVRKRKPLTEAQIVFTIIGSEIAKFKRAGQKFDATLTRQSYQQHYHGWNREQLLAAAFNLVQIHDKSTGNWRLVANEQELRSKQVQFSKRLAFFKNRTNNA